MHRVLLSLSVRTHLDLNHTESHSLGRRPGRFPQNGTTSKLAAPDGTVTIDLRSGNYYSSLSAIEPRGSHNPESRSYRGS